MNQPQFTQLSSRVLRKRLPCIGYIKCGAKGPRAPEKWDHFKVTTRARDNQQKLIVDTAVHEVLNQQRPTVLDVRLLFNEISHNWQTSLSAYDGQGPRCRGNGETAIDRQYGPTPCPCPALGKHFQGEYPKQFARPADLKCKPWGVLSVLLDAAQSYGGFHVFKTTSWETISGISAQLEMFKQQFGFLAFLPLQLQLYPKQVRYQKPGGGEGIGTAYSVALVLRGSMDTAFQIAAAAKEKREQALLLSGGVEYTPEEHAVQLQEIAREDEKHDGAEFHSDAVQTEEADFEIEEEIDPLEPRIRIALELLGQDKPKVNRKVAQYEGRLAELAANIEQHSPDAWKRAGERLEAEAAAAAEEPTIEPEPVKAGEASALDLFPQS